MRKMLNILFISSENVYLYEENNNIVIKKEDGFKQRVVLNSIESIICLSHATISGGLVDTCSKKHIQIHIIYPYGGYQGTYVGKDYGRSIHLRKQQYKYTDDEDVSLYLARQFMQSKITNSIMFYRNRTKNLHGDSKERVTKLIQELEKSRENINNVNNLDELLVWEGYMSALYFGGLNHVIKNKDFVFNKRTKRPPMDEINAMLSYLYTILISLCGDALYSVGLDPFAGFYHQDRSGRQSLACDLAEEFRAYFVDSLVMNLINERKVNSHDFITTETGAVRFTDECRKVIQKEFIIHRNKKVFSEPLGETIQVGNLIYLQAIRLARYIRGESKYYEGFTWKRTL